MGQSKRIRAGMVVKSRDGEPLGRVISVDDEGFVLEHKVVVTRERRVRLEDVHALEDHGVVLDGERTSARPLDAADLAEAFWTSRHARDAQRPLSERRGAWTGPSQRRVAVTEHAEAYPIQVERGTVRSPRYVPMSEEQFRRTAAEQPRAPRDGGGAKAAPRPKRQRPAPWSRRVKLLRDEVVKHYAARPFLAATSLLEKLRGRWRFSEH